MAAIPHFSIEPFKALAPAARSLPVGPSAMAGAAGFAGSLGQALGAKNLAAASELMLNQSLMDILGEGGAVEGGGGGDMNALMFASLLGSQAGPGANLAAELTALAGKFPGGAEGLMSALRQVAESQAVRPGAAPDAAALTGAPPAAPAAPTLPAALDPASPAQDELADPGLNLARNAGLKAYGRAARHGSQGDAGAQPAATAPPDAFSSLLGRLSARFESGDDPAAVGHDRVGGTSYGIYQISSRAGTMDQFIGFLQARRPDWAAALEAAGPTDTGGTAGAMPAAWRALAAQDPEGFAKLQHEFIGKHHFLPAAERIREITGLDLAGNPALAEVLWSTAVQHGPTGAAGIVRSAAEAVGPSGSPNFAASLVGEIYKRRAGQFGASDAPVQEAVRSRLEQERDLALALLRTGGMLDSEV